MSENQHPVTGQVKVMAAIGGVCVQWALLEHLALGLLSTITSTPLERIYIMFGSLDMKPRFDMAILLARAEKVPVPLTKRIEAIRTALKVEGLTDRRNQAIHGVHSESSEPDAIDLTMPRLSGPRRKQTVTAIDLAQLCQRLQELQFEVTAIGEEIFNWKIRVLENRKKHAENQLASSHAPFFLKFAKNLYACTKHMARKFRL